MSDQSPCSLTVVVCTYRRPKELKSCLKSLQTQLLREDSEPGYIPAFKVLVVDNAGESTIKELTVSAGFDYVYEPQTGLSHARNRGARTATTDWVLYLDDDAKAHPNLIQQTLDNIANEDFGMVGGRFEHWFATPPPKWFPDPFEGGGKPTDANKLTKLSEGEYLFGGIMAIERKLLIELGGFNTDYGMQGRQLAYGEETELQIRLRRAAVPIFYDPNMVIDHLVAIRKYKLSYHLESAYRHGLYNEDWLSATDDIGSLNWVIWLWQLGRTVTVIPVKAVGKLLLRRDYYWQNAVIEVVGGVLYCVGWFVAVATRSARVHI